VTPQKKKEIEMDNLGFTAGADSKKKFMNSPSPARKTENQIKEISRAIETKVLASGLKAGDPPVDPDSEFYTTDKIGWFAMI
jgi:hypothetical protein